MLFGIEKGIFCQQVNCQNVMGAGLAKAIMKEYPIVAEMYHKAFEKNAKEELFGRIQMVQVEPDLWVANLFTQFSYGNPAKSGKIYTDVDKLVLAIRGILRNPNFDTAPVYVPYGIGCGFGGEDWKNVEDRLLNINRNISCPWTVDQTRLIIWDTRNCREFAPKIEDLELP